jgi:hypothetical protein
MKAKKYKGSMKQRVGSLRDKHDWKTLSQTNQKEDAI